MPEQRNRANPQSGRLLTLLEQHAPLHPGVDPQLGRVISAVLSNPGGLFRAQLTLQAAQAYRLPDASAESLACAVEYFHAASLLFDDLPCMDDASVRRGEICAHLFHGEAATILAALALITRGYALTGAAIALAPADRHGLAHALLEHCLGTAGMLNGQARDLHFHDSGGAKGVIRVAFVKTVPLIRLCLELPALLGGADGTERRILRRLGVCWGLFYQGVDDLADLTQGTDVHGKSAHQDQRLERPNVASQLGHERTGRYLRRLEHVARECVGTLERLNPGLACLRPYHRGLTARLEPLSAFRS